MRKQLIFLLVLLALAGCAIGGGAPPATSTPAVSRLATDAPETGPSGTPAAQSPAAGATGTPAILDGGTPPATPAQPSVEPTPQATAVGQQPAQWRALWVDAFHDGFRTPEQVAQLIADAKRGQLNALVVQIRRRGDAFYNSSIEPRAETEDERRTPLPPGFDPLQELITQGHASGIEVHAWIAALPIWHREAQYQTSDPSHVWHRHGPDAPGNDNWIMLRLNADGSTSPTYALDPGHPSAAQYTVDVALDLVSRYDVDGLHLDYIRYGERDEGYNPVSLARFNRLHGRDGMPDPADELWKQWRRDQVSDLVRRLYVEIQAVKPKVKLSAAAITWGGGPLAEADWLKTAAYARVYQDWRAWSEEGILDLAMPMNYFREHVERERAWYDEWAEWQRNHQYGRHVLIGPGAYTNYIEGSLAQIRRGLAPSAATGAQVPGVGIYDYSTSSIGSNDDYLNPAAQESLPRQPWEYRPQLNQIFFQALSEPASYQYASGDQLLEVRTEPVFAGPAAVPAMPWKERPSNGSLGGWLRAAPGGSLADVDGITLSLSGPASRSLRSDGNGWFGAVELPPGLYKLSGLDHQGRLLAAEVRISAGAVTPLEIVLE